MIDRPPLDVLLSLQPPHIEEIAQRLRSIVRRAVPDAIEIPDALQAVRPGRRVIGYRVPLGRLGRRRAPYFAWILAEQVHAHLGFTHGVLLADPDRLLEGRELRRERYVTFTDPGDMGDEGRLVDLLCEAASVASLTHAERMARLMDDGERRSRPE